MLCSLCCPALFASILQLLHHSARGVGPVPGSGMGSLGLGMVLSLLSLLLVGELLSALLVD